VFTSSRTTTRSRDLFQTIIQVEGEEKIELSSLSPGHGIIVSQDNGHIVIDQALGRAWYKKFNHWMTKEKENMDPHTDIRPGQKCNSCRYKAAKD